MLLPPLAMANRSTLSTLHGKTLSNLGAYYNSNAEFLEGSSWAGLQGFICMAAVGELQEVCLVEVSALHVTPPHPVGHTDFFTAP